MDVETGANKLVALGVAGVALVIVLGIAFTNYSTNLTQMTNAGVSNAILANFTSSAGAVANTTGTNSNYVFYILFMALVLAVVLGALAKSAKTE